MKANIKTTSYHEYLIDSLQNPHEAAAYLEVSLEEYEQDGDFEALLSALLNVAEAKKKKSRTMKKQRISKQNLYSALSKKGATTFQTLDHVLHRLGFRLSIEPLKNRA